MFLTLAQKLTLKAAILAETDPTLVALRTAGDEQGMADWYNAASTFVAWKSSVTIRDTGQVFDGAEWAGMTSSNHTRLQTVAQYLMAYNPALPGIRAMFNDIWSGAGGNVTRPALLALWKRFALRGERVFCTGIGTDGSPGQFTAEGTITAQNVADALAA